MGILKPFNRTTLPIEASRIPSGCFAVHREGEVVSSTLPTWFPHKLVSEIADTVLKAIRSAEETGLSVSELHINYAGIEITGRDLRGGALIFLRPRTIRFTRQTPPSTMSYKNVEDFILHIEAHVECWKQFNHYVNLARDKKFTPEDEAQFLDLKSLITQGSESIAAAEVKGGPRKEDIVGLFSATPSLRYLSDMSDTIQTVEGQWHRIYLTLQSLLGQLKVQQNKAEETKGGWSLFGRK
jgi:hypothetical protein